MGPGQRTAHTRAAGEGAKEEKGKKDPEMDHSSDRHPVPAFCDGDACGKRLYASG